MQIAPAAQVTGEYVSAQSTMAELGVREARQISIGDRRGVVVGAFPYPGHGSAIATGAIILTAVTHVNIAARVGYGSAQACLLLAVAAGVGVSAFVVGHAWNGNRRWLAVGLVLVVAMGEF